MKFLNPAGLWLLLGIPVLILIHLIRPHHEDRPVSSTFIWKLSSRFMKKRLPLQRFQRILLFLLQLLLVASVALIAARPARITGKSSEYIAIIDASASMNVSGEDGVTRFHRATQEALTLSEHMEQGHRVTVIIAGDSPQLLVQSATTPGKLQLSLDSARPGLGGCDVDAAVKMAQQICDRGPAEVFLYTDSPYPTAENIEVVNLNQGEWNVSVDGIDLQATEEGESFAVGTLTSHNRDANLTVGLRLDGTIVTAHKVKCAANTPTEVTFSLADTTGEGILEVFVEIEDGLAEDNSYSLCTGHSQNYSVYLASKSPFYLQSVLSSLQNCSVAHSKSINEAELTGYDLYIFDGLYPTVYPTDGSVIQFGTEQLPEGLGALERLVNPTKLAKPANATGSLFQNLNLYDVSVSGCTPLSGSAQWSTLLTCGRSAAAMTREFGVGMRFTVFGFDLHDTNLPMQTDYVVLMRNLLEASVFDLMEGFDYAVGQTVPFTVLPSALELYAELPDGSIKPLTIENRKSAMIPEVPGVYTAVVSTTSGGDYADFYVHIPSEEILCQAGPAIGITHAATDTNAEDAVLELWFWLAAAALLLLILEWGVYHYAQY